MPRFGIVFASGVADPEMVARIAVRRVDDAENMARVGQCITRRAFDQTERLEGAAPRRDVVFGCADCIERLLHQCHVDRNPVEHHGILLRQLVFEIKLAQAEAVQRARQARAVGVPVQHAKWRWRLTVQILVHDVMPDQTVGPQHAERPTDVVLIEITLAGHDRFNRGQALFINEGFDFSRAGKIDQR